MPKVAARLFLPAIAIMALAAPAAQAQDGFLEGLRGRISLPAERPEQVLTATAQFTEATQNAPSRLFISVEIARGYHIYSLTQPLGGPLATKIKLDQSSDYRQLGVFKPWPAPKAHISPEFNDLRVEEHAERVTWHAPIEIAAGVDAHRVRIAGQLNAMACNSNGCLPPKNFAFVAEIGPGAEIPPAELAGHVQPPSTDPGKSQGALTYVNPRVKTVLRGRLEPRVAVRGGNARLILSAEPAEGWHVYGHAKEAPPVGSQPTVITLTKTSGLEPSDPVADPPPVHKEDDPIGYHDGPVDWTIEFAVPRSAEVGSFSIAGLIGYQSCLNNDGGCDKPEAVSFNGALTVGDAEVQGITPISFTEVRSYRAALDPAIAAIAGSSGRPLAPSATVPGGFDPAKLEIREFSGAKHTSLWIVLGLALVGGLILNAMPCVLPVIGLKILSFVEQSAHDRGRVFALNVWYSLGLISVFMVLATLAVFLNLGWGEQFTSTGFNIAMASLVFVMALSFLGVWEIPIPGFAGRGSAAQMASREGATGAFAKGVLTTVLATPCSGPFLGPVFGFTLIQPPAVTYAVFFCVGLGMAAPYLLVGAFPWLIRFLPKPGVWMDTFKQTMGFVLLGTVVFLFNSIDRDLFVPSLAFLMGLWAAFWWIGRTPLFAGFKQQARAWAGGATIAATVGVLAFAVLVPGENMLPWEPFSREALQRYTADERTVLVDFTADW